MRKLRGASEEDVRMAKIAASLKLDIEETRRQLAASPCYYRGCKLFAWCIDCNGWHEGCEARRPELLYKNANGTWKDEDP